MLLVKWSCDWADEFQTEGFKIFTEDEWNEFKSKMTAYSGHLTWYFGTNEGYDDETADFYLKHMKVHQLSTSEVTLFKVIFPDAFDDSFGQFPYFYWDDALYSYNEANGTDWDDEDESL